MTLREMSKEYDYSASLLRQRLRLLRGMLATEEDPERIWQLKQRIAQLVPMLTEMRELAELTARYYDRGYYRNDQYTLQRISGQAIAKRSAAAARSECD